MDLETLVGRLSILTKDLTVEPLVLNWAQREFIATAQHQLETTGKIRIIVLKARQIGISTITEAMLYVLCQMFDNYKAMVIAHEVPASQNLLNMTRRYYDTDPLKPAFTTEYAGKNYLQWAETQSSIGVATAGNQAVGRSATIHALHASEVAFWPDPKTVMLGLRQTIPSTPGTAIVIESTAEGMGNYFHQQWLDAVAGESEYAALFFPWHKHPEYTASAINLPMRDLGRLDEDERALRDMGVSDDRLLWRRWAIRDLCQNDLLKYKQEYPATPDEAFIASGTNVFPHGDLASCYAPEPGYKGILVEGTSGVDFKRASDGPLTVYRMPATDDDYGQYLVSGDPTHTTRGDFACVQVLNRRTLEQVAEWRGRIDPIRFADVLFQLGLFYNTALVTTEIEGPGYSTIGALLGKNYPRIYNKQRPDNTPGKVSSDLYGWSTTAQSKHLAMGWMKNVIVAKDLKFHSSQLYNELKNYVVLENGGYGPANNEGYDDTVMAMAIGVACHMLESPPMPYTGVHERVSGVLTPDLEAMDEAAQDPFATFGGWS